MIFRIGTDIVYIPRIEAAIARFGDRFLQRIYTPTEQQDGGKDAQSYKIKTLAGRWAAKEAVVKALGTGFTGIRYTDVEIQRLPGKAPQVVLHRAVAARIAALGCQWQLSISHDGDYAIATALLCTFDQERQKAEGRRQKDLS